MFRLVKIGRAAISMMTGTAVVLLSSNALTESAEAMVAAVQPQLTFTCQFNNGPRAGQTQSYAGVTGIQPTAVGAPCADGQGSSGVTVPEGPAQAALPLQSPTTAPPQGMTFTCRFNSGSRARQTQSYAGVTGIQPMPLGTPCTDGQGSSGVAVEEANVPIVGAPESPSGPAPQPTTFTITCQYNSGPRAGQSGRLTSVPALRPIPVGAPCTDGHGNVGSVDALAPEAVTEPSTIDRPLPEPPIVQDPPIQGSAAANSDAEARAVGAPEIPPPLGNVPAAQDPVLQQAPEAPVTRGSSVIAAGAAVGTAVQGLDGAVWADPDNTGYVTGYTYHGRYHPGTPPAYQPEARVASSGTPNDRATGAVTIPPNAIVGHSVQGLNGAVWVDRNNDGVVDGYIDDGRYYEGAPAGYAATGAATSLPSPPPPPPSPPPLLRSGERG